MRDVIYDFITYERIENDDKHIMGLLEKIRLQNLNQELENKRKRMQEENARLLLLKEQYQRLFELNKQIESLGSIQEITSNRELMELAKPLIREVRKLEKKLKITK